ncbi:MAG: biotin transporter BioY [Lachnospiraceae bacterium]|nr:biotin transporter BioY [Lachnospiraceae bacterium]
MSTIANSKEKSKLSIHQLTAAALMTALMCILGPLSIPIGAVPISFTNLVIYLAVYLLGTRLGTISYLVYLLLGAAGLPVFSGYSGGLAKLAGPTGGYLVGFIFMAIISGVFVKKSHYKQIFSILGMVIGTLVAYLFGTIWFVLESGCTIWYALTVCVFPFLIGDAIKILLASNVGLLIRNALNKANLLEQL